MLVVIFFTLSRFLKINFPYHNIQSHTLLYHTISSNTVSKQIKPFHTIPYHTFIQSHNTPFHLLRTHTTADHLITLYTKPYHLIPHHTIWYVNLFILNLSFYYFSVKRLNYGFSCGLRQLFIWPDITGAWLVFQ